MLEKNIYFCLGTFLCAIYLGMSFNEPLKISGSRCGVTLNSLSKKNFHLDYIGRHST